MNRTARFILWGQLLAAVVLAFVLSAAAPSATPTRAAYTPDRWGTPEGTVIQQGEFLLAFDGRTRCPRWTLELLTAKTVKHNASRQDKFSPPAFVPQEFRPALRDYAGATANGQPLDRGHCAPAADFAHSQQAEDATFSLANMTPQNATLNRGLWKQLEKEIRDQADGKTLVWVVTVPLFAPDKDGNVKYGTVGDTHVAVPTGYAKAILVLHVDQNLPADLPAWIVPNKVPPANAATSDYCVTVDELERAAGLDLWADLEKETQDRLEAHK
jgi:endonuclease G